MNLRSIGFVALLALTPTLAFASPPEAEGSVALGGSVGGDEQPAVDADADASADANLEPSSTADADADTSADANASADAKPKDRGEQKWIKRWAPEKNMGEIGIYGGVLLPSENHELFAPDADLPRQGYQPLKSAAPDLGLRLGFYPSRFFGIEAEGGVMPTQLADESASALLYTVRGQLVAQLGLWSITPFVLVGGGALGVSSDRSALGNDVDPSLHWGGGVKFFVNRYVSFRIDIRDVVTHKVGEEEVFNSHSPEFLLGLSITLGRKKNQPVAEPTPGPSDRDHDGLLDDADSCPDDPETVNGYLDDDGCPESDRDGDGFWDDQDTCPDEAETVNEYLDDDGCPESDRDGDGFWDDQDSCPDVPETVNGFKDDDGCDDELPDEVKAFTGAIKGITFENDSDAIRPSSTATLENAVEVLTNFPDIKLKIVGHTDSKGNRDHNLDLSQRRAAAVKKYLVDHGIAEARLTTEGFGPDKPIDTNDTKAGRANNRRIEFEMVQRAAN